MRVRVATAIKDKNPKDCADCSPRRPLIVGEGEVEETITKTQKRYRLYVKTFENFSSIIFGFGTKVCMQLLKAASGDGKTPTLF